MGSTKIGEDKKRVNQYRRGRNLEYKVKKQLELLGYEVIRSAGSHSRFDLIAISKDDVRFIQLKRKKIGVERRDITAEYFTRCTEEFWVCPDARPKHARISKDTGTKQSSGQTARNIREASS